MDTDKVSKLDDKQLDNVKGGSLIGLALGVITAIATFGGAVVVGATTIACSDDKKK